jgi:hypothetical protein
MGFQQAYLVVEGDSQRRIDVWFNPTTLELKNSARWQRPNTLTGDAPSTYLGGREQALNLKFLFHADGQRTGEDVKAKIAELRALLKPVSQKIAGAERDRPPTVEFVWGTWTSEPSVVSAVDVTTELFDEAGLPLRAWVNLTMSKSLEGPEEAAKKKGTNPTTKGTRRRRGHQVAPGENIALIAHEHFRTPTRWKEIAEMNDLDDPLRVQAPRLLIVPLEHDE